MARHEQHTDRASTLDTDPTTGLHAEPATGEHLEPTADRHAEPITGPGVTPAIRVLVVDDHLGFAGLLGAVLDAEPDLQCVGLAGDGDDAVACAADLMPDVVLMDIQMPGRDGIAVTREIRSRWPAIVVVVMTAFRDPLWATRAHEAGAAELVVKDGTLDTLLDAVRCAHRPA